MTVSEIRISNWLWHSTNQKAVQVKEIMGDKIWYNEGWGKGTKFYSDISKFEGIDINLEMLEDFGFHEMILNEGWIKQIEIFNEDTDDEQGVRLYWSENQKEMMIEMHSRSEDKDFYENSHFMITPVKSLHQLQNLFYSLTGLELSKQD